MDRWARGIADRVDRPASGARFLDAPVARTPSQAESRQVVGGNESGFEHTKSMFQAIGCGLVLKVAVDDLPAVQVAWESDCFQATTIMQAIAEIGTAQPIRTWHEVPRR